MGQASFLSYRSDVTLEIYHSTTCIDCTISKINYHAICYVLHVGREVVRQLNTMYSIYLPGRTKSPGMATPQGRVY